MLEKGRVVISLQDVNPSLFNQRSRGRLSWPEYIGRIRNFVRMAEKRDPPLSVQIHYMLDIHSMGWNIPRILRMQRRIQDIYDRWKKGGPHDRWARVNVLDPARSFPLGTSSSFYVKHKGNWDNQLIPEYCEVIPLTTGHCALMTDTFAILSDGRCTFCCDDYEGSLNLGNANEHTQEEIYCGVRATGIRASEKKGVFTEKRCMNCRGTLIDNRRNGKLAGGGNLLTDLYVFRDHLRRYGIRSAVRKAKAVFSRRYVV